jgi:hypothetical protein
MNSPSLSLGISWSFLWMVGIHNLMNRKLAYLVTLQNCIQSVCATRQLGGKIDQTSSLARSCRFIHAYLRSAFSNFATSALQHNWARHAYSWNILLCWLVVTSHFYFLKGLKYDGKNCEIIKRQKTAHDKGDECNHLTNVIMVDRS